LFQSCTCERCRTRDSNAQPSVVASGSNLDWLADYRARGWAFGSDCTYRHEARELLEQGLAALGGSEIQVLRAVQAGVVVRLGALEVDRVRGGGRVVEVGRVVGLVGDHAELGVEEVDLDVGHQDGHGVADEQDHLGPRGVGEGADADLSQDGCRSAQPYETRSGAAAGGTCSRVSTGDRRLGFVKKVENRCGSRCDGRLESLRVSLWSPLPTCAA
jgi:hypothetical protein